MTIIKEGVHRMEYWVTDCITGIYGEENLGTGLTSIEEARKIRDEWNAKRKAEGGSDEFWIIVNRNGKEVK